MIRYFEVHNLDGSIIGNVQYDHLSVDRFWLQIGDRASRCKISEEYVNYLWKTEILAHRPQRKVGR